MVYIFISISCYRRFFAALIFAILFTSEALARDVYVKISGGSMFAISTTQGNIAMIDAEGRLANLGASAVISVSGNYGAISGNSFCRVCRVQNLNLRNHNYEF